jgi:hypothetical protein
MLDQKQMENVEYFKYLGSLIASVRRCTREIKSSIPTEQTRFTSRLDWNLKEKTNEMLHLEHNFAGCWNLYSSKSRLEISWTFWNVVLEKEGEDELDRSSEKWSITEIQEGKEHRTYNKTKEG